LNSHHYNLDVYKAIEKDAECPKNLTKSNVDDWDGGRVHDLKLWDESGLEVFMEEDDILRSYLLFGDQGYENEKHLMCPFPGASVSYRGRERL
jgi:hypothetical protein